jgi:hypothetical protein
MRQDGVLRYFLSNKFLQFQSEAVNQSHCNKCRVVRTDVGLRASYIKKREMLAQRWGFKESSISEEKKKKKKGNEVWGCEPNSIAQSTLLLAVLGSVVVGVALQRGAARI